MPGLDLKNAGVRSRTMVSHTASDHPPRTMMKKRGALGPAGVALAPMPLATKLVFTFSGSTPRSRNGVQKGSNRFA